MKPYAAARRVAAPRAASALWVICLALPALAALPACSRADRIVLAPKGIIAPPFSLKGEAAIRVSGARALLGWVQIGMPMEELGLELEVEHLDRPGLKRDSLSVQYSLTGNALVDIAPAISVGARDILNRGREGRSLFVAATKGIGVSEAQEKLVRDVRAHFGVGTARAGGVFLGLEGRVSPGVLLSGELLARRFNGSLAIPIGKYLQLRGYSLNGRGFVGASLFARR